MMRKRLLFAVFGLALALGAVFLLRPNAPAKSLQEYYARLYPRGQLEVRPDPDGEEYDYPALLEKAKAVLVVTPEEALQPGGSGYFKRREYSGVQVEDKYAFSYVQTLRRVRILQVIKGENAAPGDTVWVAERCVLIDWEHVLARAPGCWPMVKDCVYLLFLDKDVSPAQNPATRTVSGANGWFDLSHLSLNEPRYLPVLTAALADQDLLLPDREGEQGDSAISTPWTEKGYALTLPPAESLEEYYTRLYPRHLCVGPTLDQALWDYPRLLSGAREVLVVTPEDRLTGAAGSGYSTRSGYAGTNPRVRYHFYNVKSVRRVKVLRVIKGSSEPDSSVWVLERCALVDGDSLLVRQTDSWPMVKGCVYLLFLDHEAGKDPEEGSVTAMPIGWANGWFDLSHLSLNHRTFLPVLTAALADQDLLLPDREGEQGEMIFSTPWTEEGYALRWTR